MDIFCEKIKYIKYECEYTHDVCKCKCVGVCPTRVGCLRNAQVFFTAVMTSCCQPIQFVIIIAAAVSFLGSAATYFFPLLLLNAMQSLHIHIYFFFLFYISPTKIIKSP